MYQIIENKQDFSKLMENLPKELKILEVPEFNKKLEMIVNAFEMSFGGDGNYENNVEAYIIILYGKKEEVLGEYKRILSYLYMEKENNGAEDGDKEYEYRKQALFRTCICFDATAVEIVIVIG